MSPRISIDNPDVLVDEPVGFSVVGCAPDEPVSVSATWRVGGVAVRTEGRFVAPPSGVIVIGNVHEFPCASVVSTGPAIEIPTGVTPVGGTLIDTPAVCDETPGALTGNESE